MIAAIIFAQVWGVIQLIVLTSLARTVRVRTVFAAMAAGFYLIGPITAFIQLSWIHVAAPLFGMQSADLQAVASYSVDPFIEEVMKLVPLVVLMLIPAIRRQWSITDCVLVGAATGSGFGLTEHLFRYSANADIAIAVSGGWVLPIGSYNTLVPGFFRTMTSWLINGAFFAADPIFINWHLAWSAIGGLAVGLIFRKRDRKALLIGVALLLSIGFDHATGNAALGDISHTWLAWVAAPFHLYTICLGLFVFTAVVIAWWLDQPLVRAAMKEGPLLAAEQAATSPVLGTLTAAVSRLPWSLPWVAGFDRERRAFHAAHIAQTEGHDRLFATLVATRDRVERKLKDPQAPPLIPDWVTKDNLLRLLRAQLKRQSVIIWLVVTAPPFLFLILGGFPETAWIQRVLTGAVIWQIVVLITIAGQARLAWRVFGGVRKLPATARLPIGDDAALLGLQLACGLGAVALGGFTLSRILGGVSSTQRLLSSHASDAAERVTPGSGSAVAGSANAAAGPGGDSSGDSGSSSGSAGSGSAGSSSGSGSSSDSSGGPPSSSTPGSSPGGDDGSITKDPDVAAAAASAGVVGSVPPTVQVNDLPDAPPADSPPSPDENTQGAPPKSLPAPNPNPLPPPPPPPMDNSPSTPSDDEPTTPSDDTPQPRLPDGSLPAPNPNPLPPPPPPTIDDTPSTPTDDAPPPRLPDGTLPAPNPNPLPPPPPPPIDAPPPPEAPSPEPPSVPVSDVPSTPPEAPSTPVNDLPNAPPETPSTPVNDLPNAPPSPPTVNVNDLPDASPPTPSVPVNDLPNAPPAAPTVNVNDLPNAPPGTPSVNVNDLPNAPAETPSVNVHDLPDSPASSHDDSGTIDGSAAGGQPHASDDTTDGEATSRRPATAADDAPTTPPAPPKPTPQDAADQAAAKAAQAQADADAAQQARRDAQSADESSWIKSRTGGNPSSDPDVAAAEARAHAAHDAQDQPGKDADPGDPWDANKNKQDADAARQNSKDADAAEADAKAAYQKQLDDAAAAAKAAANQADDAANTAAANAAAAKQAAATAQANADAAAAKAAADAARAADPAQAAANDAAKAAADAQKRADSEFYDAKDIDGQKYHDANAAAAAARAKAEAAQAAADAAHQKTASNDSPFKKKP